MMNRRKIVIINPQVFKWLREDTGFTEEEVAASLNIDISTVQKWENSEDDIEIPFKYLKKLERLYRRPLYLFYLPKAPEVIQPNNYRKVAGITQNMSKDTLRAIRKARYIAGVIEELLQIVDEDINLNIKHYTLSDNPEEIAKYEREQLNIRWPIKSFEQIKEKIEARGVYVLQFDFPLEDARGFVIKYNKILIIVINENDTISAKIFTLLHEYAHILLGDSKGDICIPEGIGIKSQSYNNNNNYSNKDDDIRVERWCNNFAASFLLPLDIIRKKLQEVNDIEKVIKEFSKQAVSKYAIIIRLLNLSQQHKITLTNNQVSKLYTRLEEIKSMVQPRRIRRPRFLFNIDITQINTNENMTSIISKLKKELEFEFDEINIKEMDKEENVIIIKAKDNRDRQIILELPIIKDKGSLKIIYRDNKDNEKKEYRLITMKDNQNTNIIKIYKLPIPSIISQYKAMYGAVLNLLPKAYKKGIDIYTLAEYTEIKPYYIERLLS